MNRAGFRAARRLTGRSSFRRRRFACQDDTGPHATSRDCAVRGAAQLAIKAGTEEAIKLKGGGGVRGHHLECPAAKRVDPGERREMRRHQLFPGVDGGAEAAVMARGFRRNPVHKCLNREVVIRPRPPLAQTIETPECDIRRGAGRRRC